MTVSSQPPKTSYLASRVGVPVPNLAGGADLLSNREEHDSDIDINGQGPKEYEINHAKPSSHYPRDSKNYLDDGATTIARNNRANLLKHKEIFNSSSTGIAARIPRPSVTERPGNVTVWPCPSETQLLSIHADKDAVTLFEKLRRHTHETRGGTPVHEIYENTTSSKHSSNQEHRQSGGQELHRYQKKSHLLKLSLGKRNSKTRCDLCFGGQEATTTSTKTTRRSSNSSSSSSSSSKDCRESCHCRESGSDTRKQQQQQPLSAVEESHARKKSNSKQGKFLVATKNLIPASSGLHHSVGSSSKSESGTNNTDPVGLVGSSTDPLPVAKASNPQQESSSCTNNRSNSSTTNTTQIPSLIPRAVKSVHFDKRVTRSPSWAMHRLPSGGSIPVKSNIRQQQQQQQPPPPQQPLRQYPPLQQQRYAPVPDPQYGHHPQQKQYRMYGPGGNSSGLPPNGAGYGPPHPQSNEFPYRQQQQQPQYGSPPGPSVAAHNHSQQYASLLESVGANRSTPDAAHPKDQEDNDSNIMTKYHSTILGFISSSSSQKMNELSSSPPSEATGQNVNNSPSAWRHRRAREKLLRLSKLQFAELATDVYDELQRRQQYQAALARRDQASVPNQLPEDSTIHSQRNQARQKLSTLPDDRFRDLASDILFEVERRYPHIPGSNGESDNSSQSKPLKATTKTIVPNKTSMVEEGDESETESATDSSSFLTGKYGSSLRGSSTSSNRESQQQPQNLNSLKTQNAELRQQLTVLNERVAEMMNLASEKEIEHTRALKDLNNNNKLLVQQSTKDTEIEEQKKKSNEDSKAAMKTLQTKLDEAYTRIEELEAELNSLRSEQSKTSQTKVENEELRREIRRQQNISEQVRQEASQFLQEMQALAAAGSSPFEASDKLSQQVVQLQQENEDWRKKYSKARTQLRNLRASTTGIGLALPKIPADRGGEFVSDDGVVRDIHLTKFQLSVDTFLIMTRQSDPNVLISKLSPVVKSVQRITSDLDSASPATLAHPLSAQCKADITATTTSLMTAIRKFAASHGLSPIGLIDVAVADLSGSVMEVVRKVKIRLTPAQELNKYVDSSDEENEDFQDAILTSRSPKDTISERTYPRSDVRESNGPPRSREANQPHPPPRNSRSKSSTRQIEYNDSYHDDDDGSNLSKPLNGNSPYGSSSLDSSLHRSAVDLLSSAETRLAKLGITTASPSPDISSGHWEKRDDSSQRQRNAINDLESVASDEDVNKGINLANQDEKEEESDWSAYMASRGSDLKRSASRVTFAEKPTQIQIYEDELTDSGSVACETPTRANAATQSSTTSTPSSDVQSPSPRRPQRQQASTDMPVSKYADTSRDKSSNNTAKTTHTRQRSWMHTFENESSSKASSSDSKQAAFASSEEMQGIGNLNRNAMKSTTDLFDHHYENDTEARSGSNAVKVPQGRDRQAYTRGSSSDVGGNRGLSIDQDSSIDYRYDEASGSWRDNSESSSREEMNASHKDETDDDFETASMLNDNKTVDDLLQFLEQETVGVVDSIQRLLTALRESSPTGVLRHLTKDIVKSVSSMVAVCQNSMSHASGTRHDLRVLKEHGQWVVHNLEDCCDRMERVHSAFKDKSDNELPDKQVRQRLAGLSFDMAKTTKELVRTVSGVANNEFS